MELVQPATSHQPVRNVPRLMKPSVLNAKSVTTCLRKPVKLVPVNVSIVLRVRFVIVVLMDTLWVPFWGLPPEYVTHALQRPSVKLVSFLKFNALHV